MTKEYILILDFGGQYNQLIARRVRECGVFCEVYPYSKACDLINSKKPNGIIFTGGPNSIYSKNAPMVSEDIFNLGIPILGICYGAQLMAHTLGGCVKQSETGEYGKTETVIERSSPLFKNIDTNTVTWMSHKDRIYKLPPRFISTANCKGAPIAAMECQPKKLYAVQFHPEVLHTQDGRKMIENFLYEICGCTGDWSMSDYMTVLSRQMKDKVKDNKVLLALSGGVDSSVAAALLSRAIGRQLTCVFVDHGFLRKNEGDEIESIFSGWDMNFVRVNAQDYFLNNIKGVSEPELKRKIIGESFIRIFEQEAKKTGKVKYLAQGTIYPDIIESGLGGAAVIKSHHNVGGLPEHLEFDEIIEPLKKLFKDEVRRLGVALGLPKSLVYRQPFPGPGLAIRIIGEITQDKLNILKEADCIFRQEIETANLNREINQYFAVLTPMKSVGVMGDFRTYGYTIALRAVNTTDFMTADFAKIPYEILGKISNRIIGEIENVNRVVYDITTKPPATIEFE